MLTKGISHLALLAHLFRGAFFLYLLYFFALVSILYVVQVMRSAISRRQSYRRSCTRSVAKQTNGTLLLSNVVLGVKPAHY